LIEQSIQSTGVINLFEGQREFSLFDEGFLAELKKMKEKNLAVQLLEKLLKERIRKYERTNVVQSQKFSDMLNMALSNYLKGMLTNEEVIEELLKMAAEIKKTEEEGNELGLSVEEKAFYDALSSPAGIREAYTDEQFVMLTKELTEQLRKNRTIDWNKKESARAKMRVLVKRLLKKYKYPPEGQEQALQVVMEQCNKWADDEENYEDKKLLNIEDDSDVRNLIYNRLQIDKEVSDLALQREVLEVFGERYPGMTPNDWRHIIEYYTSMIRKAHQEAAIEIPMDYPQAAEDIE
jgi:type I restriction enzyme R subunit